MRDLYINLFILSKTHVLVRKESDSDKIFVPSITVDDEITVQASAKFLFTEITQISARTRRDETGWVFLNMTGIEDDGRKIKFKYNATLPEKVEVDNRFYEWISYSDLATKYPEIAQEVFNGVMI